MTALDRSYWLAVALCAYVGIAGVQSAGPSWAGLMVVLAGPLLLAWVWRRTQPNTAASSVEPAALVAARVGVTAALGWMLTRSAGLGTSTADEPALELAATLAAGAAAVSASYGLARIAPVPGLIGPPQAARSVDAAAFCAFLWSVALVVSAARFFAPEIAPLLGPLTLDYATTAASIGSLLVLIAVCFRVRVLRQLELGIADRAEAATALSVTALAVAVPLAAIDVAPPDRVLPAALIAGSLGCLWTVLAKDPAQVSIVMRGTVAVMLLGVPSALMVAVIAQQAGSRSGIVALVGCAASIVVGLIARNVARPLGPEQSRWLLALSEASERALVPEPRAAIVETLRALKKASKDPRAVPQLWRLDPPSVLDVDVAGYLHEADAEVPQGLCALAIGEPERTLRTESLSALEVRRPEVRPLLSWFQVRGAFSATIVVDEDGPLGFLLLPRGDRTARMSLEEAQAARSLADRISGLLSVSSALARSRERETRAETEAKRWAARAERAERVVEGAGSRHEQLAKQLSRPLLSSAYSPAVRTALAQLEHAATRAVPLSLIAPPGVNVVAWAAVLHTKSSGRSGPLVCIDAAQESDESAKRWLEPSTSPFCLAGGGTLFIHDLHLLPMHLQTHLTEQLTKALAESELAPPLLLVSVPSPTAELVKQGRVHPALASLLDAERLELPSLEQRAEDLRALILDAAARVPGSGPRGVDRRAMQLLLDYPWPGNERQLADVVERATLASDGPLLTVEALRATGFAPAFFDSPIAETHAEAESRTARPSIPPRRRPRAPRRPRRSP